MELTTQQQIFDQIKKSNKILVLLPYQASADSVASGLALRLFLKKLRKEAVVVSGGAIPENLKFLPGAAEIETNITKAKSLVIVINTAVKKLDEISYETESDKVKIFLKSREREFAQEDLSFEHEKFPIDLIIVLDAASLNDLGQVFESQTDIFFETPKINIDNKAANEYFGGINLVDITATSVSEILADLFQKYEQELIDEDIATCLLAGIIEKTGSFQRAQTTPKAFIKASELVNYGGRQQEIVKHIYKTKSLPLLKLWGRALARMKILEDIKVIYSVLGTADFERAEATEAEVLPALKEFIDHVGGYKVIALITEARAGQARLLAAVHEQEPVEQILKQLGEAAKVLDFSLNHYKLIEYTPADRSLENLEAGFLEALKILPKGN